MDLTAHGGNAYRGAVVPAKISLTLRVGTDQTSSHDLIVGKSTPIGSLTSGESRSWTLPISGPRSFGLSVGGGATGECPDLEVLDPTGAVIGGLGDAGTPLSGWNRQEPSSSARPPVLREMPEIRRFW